MLRFYSVFACLAVLVVCGSALADQPLDPQLYFALGTVDKIKVDSTGKLRIPVECDEVFGCSGTITIVTKAKLLIGNTEKRVTLVRKPFEVGSGKHPAVLRLDASKRSLVAAARRLAVIVKADVHDRSANRAKVQLPGTLIAPHTKK
ncbi:MAG: hypothetical protein QOJ29_4606 [Thermoleophilaceae bacterium]|nr:hypothetical protein [Thermoleophilaceae bacterium]